MKRSVALIDVVFILVFFFLLAFRGGAVEFPVEVERVTAGERGVPAISSRSAAPVEVVVGKDGVYRLDGRRASLREVVESAKNERVRVGVEKGAPARPLLQLLYSLSGVAREVELVCELSSS